MRVSQATSLKRSATIAYAASPRAAPARGSSPPPPYEAVGAANAAPEVLVDTKGEPDTLAYNFGSYSVLDALVLRANPHPNGLRFKRV